jgi:hypothetical protein
MSPRLFPIVIAFAALAFGVRCTSSEQPLAISGGATLESATPCDPVAACDLVIADAAKGSYAVTKTLTCCLAAIAITCGPKPTPVPPVGVGGSSSVGGATAAGGARATGGSAGTAGATYRSQCQLACDNYQRLGCPEDQATCASQCEILTHDNRFTFDVTCRIKATTKAAIQKCGVGSCK